MNPVRVVPPSGPVVPLSDLKAHLRVLHDDEDALIQGYEAAAVAWMDGYSGVLGRCILPQTWEESLPCWGAWALTLSDVISAQVVYLDSSDSEQILTSESFSLHHGPLASTLVAFGPSPARSQRVRYVCAMPDGDRPAIRQAILMLVAHWYQHRAGVGDAGVTELPFAVRALIDSKKSVRL